MSTVRNVTNAQVTHDFVTSYTMVGNQVMPMARPVPGRMVGVWAHPDDEAYLSAGLMGRVSDAGGDVTVVTATKGEKGTADPDLYDRDEFGSFREAELRTALGEVGVDDVRFLGMRDGECDLVADELAVQAIVDVLVATRPDVVVTFGPDGMTNHPDHRAVSRWTTEAVRRVADLVPGIDLLYATQTRAYMDRFADLHAEIGVFDDFGGRGGPAIPQSCVDLEARLTDAEVDRKRRALAGHASQTDGLAALMGEETYREWSRNEVFRRPTAGELAECPLAASFDAAHTTVEGAARELAGVS
ncbi:MAG: PIG-L family deacetylase [Acidimicrobiia bacterium]|nr:PIG-L family deacetylase [Acidimicrobiia bacterium]